MPRMKSSCVLLPPGRQVTPGALNRLFRTLARPGGSGS
jgi:hypothetical protein